MQKIATNCNLRSIYTESVNFLRGTGAKERGRCDGARGVRMKGVEEGCGQVRQGRDHAHQGCGHVRERRGDVHYAPPPHHQRMLPNGMCVFFDDQPLVAAAGPVCSIEGFGSRSQISKR